MIPGLMIRGFFLTLALLLVQPAAAQGATQGEARDGTAPLHHDIRVSLDPDSGRLDVIDRIAVDGRDRFAFRLAPWLTLDRVSIDGAPVEPEATDGLYALALSGQRSMELRYGGTVPPLPSEAARDGFYAAVGGAEGVFLPAGTGWLPETDDTWLTFTLAVTVPSPYRAVSTGRLEQETLGDRTNEARFVADYPSEPPSLFAGPYRVREHQADGVRLRTYFHAELAELSEDYLKDSARFIARFSDAIGPYPFRDFHVISAPLPVGLGFPNLTYIGRRVLPLPFIRGRSLAHEVLHNWWGNGVAIDHAGGNWAEGLTTYMADYALAADRGAAPAREMRLGWLRDYAALPAERDDAVTGFTSKRHDASQVIGYNKVAFIFHMLRQEVGEAAFAEALRLFWQRERFRVAGWAEIREAFEDASGADLSVFFAQWLNRSGAPRLFLDGLAVEDGGRTLSLTLRQDTPTYRLSVPVTVESEAGLAHRTVVLDESEATVTLALDAPATAVHVDPDHDLFRRLLPGEAAPILRDVTLSDDALTLFAVEAEDGPARALAGRLLDTPVKPVAAKAATGAEAPLLVIGLTERVEALLAESGLPAVPQSLAGRGSARVWTARRDGGQPLLVVAADDGEALQALLRPLPHYGRKSYLVFEGRRAVETGIWPATESPLRRRIGSGAD